MPSSLWRNRDFMALWSGELVSDLGSSMSFFLFPILGYALTGSATQAALAGAAYTLGTVVMGLPAGVWVDRCNRRAVMIASNVAGSMLYASLAVATLLHHLALPQLLLTALITGVVGRFLSPAETAAIKSVVPREQLPTAFSQNQARQHMASLVGPPLGGALFGVLRWIPFLMDAVSFLLPALAIGRIKTPLPAPKRADQGSMRADIGEGLRFLSSSAVLRAIVVFAGLVNFASGAFFIVLTLKLLSAGIHPAAIGLIEAFGAVAGIGGAIVAPALINRVPTGSLSIMVGVAVAVAVIPMAFTNSVVTIGLLLAVALFLLPAGNASISSYLVAITSDQLQGRVGSALNFAATLLSPAAPIVGGLLFTELGGGRAMLAMAAILSLSVLPLVVSQDMRRLGPPHT
ncbi:MAG: MFS transporter [Nocardioidaceae bacterium]